MVDSEINELNKFHDLLDNLINIPVLTPFKNQIDNYGNENIYECMNLQDINVEYINNIPIYSNPELSTNSYPILLCIHNIGTSGLIFYPLMKISTNLNFISFDFNGHGLNKNPINESDEKYVENFANVIDFISNKYNHNNILILTCGDGCLFAMDYLKKITENKDETKIINKINGLIYLSWIGDTPINQLEDANKGYDCIEDAIKYFYHNSVFENLNENRTIVPFFYKQEQIETTENSEMKNNTVFKLKVNIPKVNFYEEFFKKVEEYTELEYKFILFENEKEFVPEFKLEQCSFLDPAAYKKFEGTTKQIYDIISKYIILSEKGNKLDKREALMDYYDNLLF